VSTRRWVLASTRALDSPLWSVLWIASRCLRMVMASLASLASAGSWLWGGPAHGEPYERRPGKPSSAFHLGWQLL
jgi:hypothetical protein